MLEKHSSLNHCWLCTIGTALALPQGLTSDERMMQHACKCSPPPEQLLGYGWVIKNDAVVEWTAIEAVQLVIAGPVLQQVLYYGQVTSLQQGHRVTCWQMSWLHQQQAGRKPAAAEASTKAFSRRAAGPSSLSIIAKGSI